MGKFIKHRSASQNRTEHAHAPSVAREYGFWRGSSFLIYPIVWIVLVLPYTKTHFLYQEATRSIRDAAHFSLGLEEIFTKYQSWATLTILAVILFHTTTKEIPKTARSQYLGAKGNPAKRGDTVSCEHGFWSVSWWLLSFSILMSLGPVLKVFGQTIKPLQNFGIDWPIPLPYALFYYLFPGFTGFRTPSRFILLALFAVCTIIAANNYIKILKTKTKITIILLVFTLLTLENNFPLAAYPININPPTVYQQVAALPNNSIILELPIKLWNMPDHQIESVRSLYSLAHKQKRFNGFSGFATLEWIKLTEEVNAYGLTNNVIQKIKDRGVTHIIQNNTLHELQ